LPQWDTHSDTDPEFHSYADCDPDAKRDSSCTAASNTCASPESLSSVAGCAP